MDSQQELSLPGTQLKPSHIEIVEGDNKNIMPLEKLNWLMAAAQAGQLVKIRRILEDQTSEGWTQTFLLNVTNTSQEVILDRPGEALSLVNAGAGQILISINSRAATPTPVNAGQPYNIGFKGHKLARFFVQCPPGATATAVAVTRG